MLQSPALLQTLHHGTCKIVVRETVFEASRCIVPYDGSNDGLFRLSKQYVYTREVLDAWLCDVCGPGGTFRDAFQSWSNKNGMTSAFFHRIGEEETFTRQRGNDAFSAFLMKLRFPSEEDVHTQFSCSSCEKMCPSGKKRLDAVVMDWSAV